MKENKKTPEIRFPEFTDDWEQRKLGDEFERVNERNDGSFGINHWISVAKMYYQDPEKVTSNNLDTRTYVMRVGDIAFEGHPNAEFEFGRFVANDIGDGIISELFPIYRHKLDYYNPYWKYAIQIERIMRPVYAKAITSSGASSNKLNEEHFLRESILVPTIEEQKKIGDYFTMLDNLITLHQHKCDTIKELKSCMLKKMFPKKGETNPEIRFPGFTDDWEQRRLGEICERVNRKNKNKESDLPLTIASQHGLIDQRDFFNKVVAAKDMSNYYLLKKGEFAYNKSYSNGFDYGSIKRLNAYEQGCLSTLYICFGITSDEVVSDYLECFFDTLIWYEDVSLICAEGARNHGLLNVDTKAFFTDVNVYIPTDLEEQKKIAAYLNALDNLIILHQRKCDELKGLKKGMQQKMFV